MFDIVRKDPTAEHTAMEGWIQRDLAVQLFRAAGLDFEALQEAAQRRDFKPVPLNSTLSSPSSVKSETILSNKVLCPLPGYRHPYALGHSCVHSSHTVHVTPTPHDR